MSKLLCVVFICISVSVALPECSNRICENGGLWSEWTTTEACPTECGSCSKILYTRKCLSSSLADCDCKGESSSLKLCNTQTCLPASARRPCCKPYTPLKIKKTMQCGPLPEEDTDTSKPCCPKGGLWSSWSGYIRNYASNGWERTRSCLSGTAGCQCTGSTVETSNKCPCRAMIDVSDKVKRNLKTFPLSVDYDGNSCTARQNLEYFNNVPTQIVPCNAWKNYLYTAAIRYVTPMIRLWNSESQIVWHWDRNKYHYSAT